MENINKITPHLTVVKPQLVPLSELNKQGKKRTTNVWRVKVIDEYSQIIEKHDFAHNQKGCASKKYFQVLNRIKKNGK